MSVSISPVKMVALLCLSALILLAEMHPTADARPTSASVRRFQYLNRRFSSPSLYDPSQQNKGKREMDRELEMAAAVANSIDDPTMGMVAVVERGAPSSYASGRNCWFSPVQCLLPMSDSAMRSLVSNYQTLAV